MSQHAFIKASRPGSNDNQVALPETGSVIAIGAVGRAGFAGATSVFAGDDGIAAR